MLQQVYSKVSTYKLLLTLGQFNTEICETLKAITRFPCRPHANIEQVERIPEVMNMLEGQNSSKDEVHIFRTFASSHSSVAEVGEASSRLRTNSIKDPRGLNWLFSAN